MSQANRESNPQSSRVHADAPGLTRRVALTLAAGTAAASAATALAATKALGAAATDPIFAAIERHRAAEAAAEAAVDAEDAIDRQIWKQVAGRVHYAETSGVLDQFHALWPADKAVTREQARDVMKWQLEKIIREEERKAEIDGADAVASELTAAADEIAWRLAATPTTLTGLAALARYGIELEERGGQWPDYGGGKSWWAAVARRVTELAVAS